MADEGEIDDEENKEMKTSSSLQHMLAVIAEERKRETATFSISGGTNLNHSSFWTLFYCNYTFCSN